MHKILSDIDLNLLVVFHAIFDEKSVSKAALKLNASQPTTSHALRRLRKIFGDVLFVKAGEGVAPTPKAQQLAPQIHEILLKLENVFGSETAFDASTATHRFRLVMSDYGSSLILPKLVETIVSEAPGVSIDILNPEVTLLPKLLASADLDLAVGHFPDLPANIKKQTLLEETWTCVVRREHPILRFKSISIDAFIAYPHAEFLRLDSAAYRVVDKHLQELGFKRKVVARVPNFLVLPKLLTGTNLIVALPTRVVTQVLDVSELALFPPPIKILPVAIDQCWHPRLEQDPHNRWIRRKIAEICSGL